MSDDFALMVQSGGSAYKHAFLYRAGGGLAVAWIAFVKQKGLSPLMPGQWKAFLAFYAGEPCR